MGHNDRIKWVWQTHNRPALSSPKPSSLIRINLAWLKMQMAQSHWRSLHVFITFNWFNYMENEMVGSAIEFFFPLLPSCHREMNILSCQEEKVMRLVLSLSLSLFLSLSPSLPFRCWWFGSSKQEELFYCYHWKHFILVSEAPTVLCGLRSFTKF